MSGVPDPVPQRQRNIGGREKLVAEVAREAGPGNGDLVTLMVETCQLEGLKGLDTGKPCGVEHRKAGRPLQSQRGKRLGFLVDRHVEAIGAVGQPGQVALLAAEAKIRLRQPEQGAVIQHMAVIVAPGRILDPSGLQLAHVAQRQAIEETFGIGSAYAVFDHRRDVEQGRRGADREIFELVVENRVRRLVARPGIPVVGGRQRLDARMERRLETRSGDVDM